MGAAIEVVDLAKSYGEPSAVVRAVDGVTSDVADGEFFGILGPNGGEPVTAALVPMMVVSVFALVVTALAAKLFRWETT